MLLDLLIKETEVWSKKKPRIFLKYSCGLKYHNSYKCHKKYQLAQNLSDADKDL